MPKKVDHEERRRSIAEALLRLAGTGGLEGVSLRSVAAEAGISMGAVQHYFGTKDEMLHFALEYSGVAREKRIVDKLSEAGTQPTPRQILRAIAVEVLPASDRSRSEWLVGIAFFARAVHDPRLAAIAAGGGAQVAEYVASLLAGARDAGDLAEGIDPSMEAMVFWSLVDSSASSTVLGERSVDDAIDAVDYYLGRVFDR